MPRRWPSGDGLDLSERLTLEIVCDHGPLPLGKAFAYLMRDYEPLPYRGDPMFWWLLQPLIVTPQPALGISETHREWPHRRQAVIEGRRNWLEYAPAERWVGE